MVRVRVLILIQVRVRDQIRVLDRATEFLFRVRRRVQSVVRVRVRVRVLNCGRTLILSFLFLVSMVVLKMGSWSFFLLVDTGSVSIVSVSLVVCCSSKNTVVVLCQSPLRVV